MAQHIMRPPGKRIAGLALHRRSVVEKRVLSLLRGSMIFMAKHEPQVEDGPSPRSQTLYFTELRRKARHAGLEIQPPETPFLNEDELALLAWLARAQRVDGLNSAILDDPLFNAQIARCAGVLDMAGLRLPPQLQATVARNR